MSQQPPNPVPAQGPRTGESGSPAPLPTGAAGRFPLRIGIDARKLDDFGIGTYLWNLIGQLGRIDGKNEYFLLHQFEGSAGLPQQPRRQWLWNGSGKYSLREHASLAWQSWRYRLDLLHCPHYVTPLLAPCPVVVTIHDIIHLVRPGHLSAGQRAYARFMIHHAVRQARRIITVSEFSRQDLIEHTGARESQVVVVPNALPLDIRPVHSKKQLLNVCEHYGIKPPFILNVGNPNMLHKNLATLVKAWRILRETEYPDLTLVIAGGMPKAPLRKHYESLAGAHSAALQYCGFVERGHLPALYSAASVFAWPSLYEGFGLPPLEAMACGTPVVSSNASAMPEVLGKGALLVDPLDAEAMADGLRQAVSDAGLRRRLVAAGKRQVKGFSWEDHARSTLAVYNDAVTDS